MRNIHRPVGPIHSKGDRRVIGQPVAGPDAVAPDDIAPIAADPTLPVLRPRCHALEKRPVGRVARHDADRHGGRAGGVARLRTIISRVAHTPLERRRGRAAAAGSGSASSRGEQERCHQHK